MSTNEWFQTLANFPARDGQCQCLAEVARRSGYQSIGTADCFLQPIRNVSILHGYLHCSPQVGFGLQSLLSLKLKFDRQEIHAIESDLWRYRPHNITQSSIN